MAGRRAMAIGIVSALMAGWLAASASAATPIRLLVPQGTAFGVLGHSCGGIQEHAFASGFDGTSGYPDGDVYLTTSCGGSGRGGGYHVTTYSAWVSATWDFTGALISDSVLSTAPTVDPTFSTFDANGNELYNESNSAFLLLSPTFVPVPRLTGISLASGSVAGGATMTITGTGFSGATEVDFGTTPASFTVIADTSITATTPAVSSAGTVDVTVTSPGGTSAASGVDQFTYVPVPTVTSLSPDNGPVSGGTSVTITGAGFTDVTSVAFGETFAGFTVNGDSSITATAPAAEAPDTEDVTVTSIGGTSATGSGSIFTYTPAVTGFTPTVTRVAPRFGKPGGGTAVTITGTNFTGAGEVDFGDTPAAAFTVVSSTSITTKAPPGNDTVDVTVTSPNGTSPTRSADWFSYGPLVTKVIPNTGSGGGRTKVTISGHNFLGTTDVSFGTQSALHFAVNSTGTTITATSPPETGSGVEAVDVTVENPHGLSPISPRDVFTYQTPTVTKLTPATGPSGTVVIITGADLFGATEVDFGSAAAEITKMSATALTVVAPAGAGTVDVTVTTSAGTSTISSLDRFTY